MANSLISQITLPSGTTYDIKDAQARNDITDIKASITAGMHFIGQTTTALTDGATTSPIKIDNADVTPKQGDLVIYGTSGTNGSAPKEFVWNGSKWSELGSTGSLKSLAFKASASGKVTPTGSVSSTFTGTQSQVTITSTANTNGNYQPAGTVTVNSTGNTNKTATVAPASSGTATYTPAGNVTVTVTPSTTTVNSITAVGTLPEFTSTVSGETLTLGWSAGTLPTKGSNTTVATGITSATGSFAGTGVRLVTGDIPVPSTFSGSFTGTKVQLSGTTTATGNINSSFTGDEKTVTVS